MINLRVKVTMRKILMIMISTGNWYLVYPIATLETKTCIFHNEHFNNILYLHKKLFQLRKVSESKCSFCELYDETLHHILMNALMHKLWNQIWLCISEKVALPFLNPQSAIFSFTDVLDHNYLLVNHLLLIFK